MGEPERDAVDDDRQDGRARCSMEVHQDRQERREQHGPKDELLRERDDDAPDEERSIAVGRASGELQDQRRRAGSDPRQSDDSTSQLEKTRPLARESRAWTKEFTRSK